MKKYFRHKLEKLIVIDAVVTIHYFEFDKNFRSRGEAHDFWELVYADKGSLICTADGRETILSEGEMLFHKPNEFHTLSADGKRAPNVFIVSFECKSEAVRFFENKKIPLDKAFVKYVYAIVEEAKRTFDIPFSDPDLKKLRLLASPTLGGEQLIKNHLEILLINVMRALTETTGGNAVFLEKNELTNKLVRDALKIMSDRVRDRLTIDEICGLTGYGRAYLFRAFKAATGKGVMEYFGLLKIERAKAMLRENELPVRGIADALSFDTPNYFSKTFKRLTGLTPTAYRRRVSR